MVERRRWHHRRVLALVAAIVATSVFTAGCGGGSTPVGSDPGSELGSAPADSGYPDVTVVDVSTGDEIALRAAVTYDRPVVLWFWAPH